MQTSCCHVADFRLPTVGRKVVCDAAMLKQGLGARTLQAEGVGDAPHHEVHAAAGQDGGGGRHAGVLQVQRILLPDTAHIHARAGLRRARQARGAVLQGRQGCVRTSLLSPYALESKQNL